VKVNGKAMGDGSGESALKDGSAAGAVAVMPGDQLDFEDGGRLVNIS
jgi:hypothetical protein